MNYKQLKKSEKLAWEMVSSGVRELQFRNMQIDFLINALEEIEALSPTPLISRIARNYIERHDLDKLAHAMVIFRK